ncbi:sensor histidine kinase, partial [Fangia hongkongensis]
IGYSDMDVNWGKTEYKNLLMKHDYAIVSGNKSEIEVEEIVEIGGESQTYLSAKKALNDIDGNVVGVVGVSINISERKQLESQVMRQKEQLEDKDRVQRDFVENFHHDVSLPLTAMSENIKFLQLFLTNPKMREVAALLEKECWSISRMLRQLKDAFLSNEFSRKIYLSQFNLRHVIESEIAIAKSSIPTTKDLHIYQQIDKHLPEDIVSDRAKLAQILRNILANAVKFTEEGSVVFGAKVLEDLDSSYRIRFFIQDTGIGIHKIDFGRIFKLGERVRPSYRGIHGMGLGLYIVKNNLDCLNGKIEVQSQVEQGSCFILEFFFDKPRIL